MIVQLLPFPARLMCLLTLAQWLALSLPATGAIPNDCKVGGLAIGTIVRIGPDKAMTHRTTTAFSRFFVGRTIVDKEGSKR